MTKLISAGFILFPKLWHSLVPSFSLTLFVCVKGCVSVAISCPSQSLWDMYVGVMFCGMCVKTGITLCLCYYWIS